MLVLALPLLACVAQPQACALAPLPDVPLELLLARLERALGDATGDLEFLGTLETARVDFERRILIRRKPFGYREELTWRPPAGAAADAAPPPGVERHSVYISDGLCAWKLADEGGPGGLLPGTGAVALLDNALLFRLLLDPRATLAALDRPAEIITRLVHDARLPGAPTPRPDEEVLLIGGRQRTVWYACIGRESGRLSRVVDATGATGRGFQLEDWRDWQGLLLPATVVETLPRGATTVTRFHAAHAGLSLGDELFGGGPGDYLDEVTDAGELRIVHNALPGAAQFMLTDVDITAGGQRLNGVWTGFDTGASALYVATSLTESLELPPIAAEFTLGAQGGGHNAVHWLDNVRLGRHFLVQMPVSTVDFPHPVDQPADKPMGLVVGGPRLLERGPVLDLAAGRLLLRGRDAAGRVKPLADITGRPALSVPLFDDGVGRPLVDVTIGARTIRALLDTGYGSVLRITRSDLRRLDLPDDDASWLARGAVPFQGSGVMGHTAEQLLLRFDGDVRFGPVTLRRPWVLIAPASLEHEGSGADTHSLLGGGALLPFAQAGLDWEGKRLELVTRPGGADAPAVLVPAPGEFLGLLLQPPGRNDPPWPRNCPRIGGVIDGSPAARVGLRAGDYLVTIDGAACDGRAPMDVWPSLWPVAGEGRCGVDLGIVRDDEVASIAIELP